MKFCYVLLVTNVDVKNGNVSNKIRAVSLNRKVLEEKLDELVKYRGEDAYKIIDEREDSSVSLKQSNSDSFVNYSITTVQFMDDEYVNRHYLSHKWADVIKAWADGKPIQYKTGKNDWEDYEPDYKHRMPRFDLSFIEWRIKPDKKSK